MSAPESSQPGLMPGVCADGSMNKLTDKLPTHAGEFYPHREAWALAVPCRYCGHGHCLPGLACQLCVMHLRVDSLAARVRSLERREPA